MTPIPAMLLYRTVDDMKRRCIDHKYLLNDPVKVIIQVAEDMKMEFAKVNWTTRVKPNVEELGR